MEYCRRARRASGELWQIQGADGAANDTINLYLPGASLNPGLVVATQTGVLNRGNFDTITSSLKSNSGYGFDEIRFGATYDDIIGATGPGIVPGDANDSGFVDDDDLAILLSNWEQDAGTITTWALGDFTADTNVDDDDLAVLLGNWTGSPPPAGAAVPEPATLALLGLGGLLAARRRRK